MPILSFHRRWRREWTPTDGIGSGGLGYERGPGGGEVEGLPSSATFPPATAVTQQVPAVLGGSGANAQVQTCSSAIRCMGRRVKVHFHTQNPTHPSHNRIAYTCSAPIVSRRSRRIYKKGNQKWTQNQDLTVWGEYA